jgi:hypothetical protein
MARQVFCRFGLPWNNCVGTLPTDDELEVRCGVGSPLPTLAFLSRVNQKVLQLASRGEREQAPKGAHQTRLLYFDLGKKIFVLRYRSLKNAPNECGRKFHHGRHFFYTTELTTLDPSYVRTRPAMMAKTTMEVRLWTSVASDTQIERMTDDLNQDDEFQQFVGGIQEDLSDGSDTDMIMVHDITSAKPSKTIPKVDSHWTSMDDSSPSSPDSYTSRDSSDSEHVVDWYI